MRQTAGNLNRAWLAVIGISLIVLSALGLLIAAGQFNRLTSAAGLAAGPRAGSPVLPANTVHPVNSSSGATILVVIGLVLVVLGLLWLIAQIPRRNHTKAFRLHDDPADGFTTCDADALTAAVSNEVESLPGVTQASALLRGTASHPELTVKLTANDRTDLAGLFDSIHTQVAHNLSTALEVPLQRLAVQADVSNNRRSANTVTL